MYLYSIVGNTLYLRFQYTNPATTAGSSNGSGIYYFNIPSLPSGITVSSSSTYGSGAEMITQPLTSPIVGSLLGRGYIRGSAAATYAAIDAYVFARNSTQLMMTAEGLNSIVSNTYGQLTVAGLAYYVEASLPLA
jgi:hypothetical protein